MTLHYRPVSLLDIPAILEIRFSVNENRLSNPNRVTSQLFEDYLDVLIEDRDVDLRGWVCECSGKVVGYCYAEKGNAMVWALFVLPGHEGKGIGKGLLNRAVAWLFEQGNDEIKLSTGINTRAERFYRAQGWVRDAMKNQEEVWYRLSRTAKALA
ncbi:GNAT superfamily N-acetyltransferase [Oxalobacteraceae bacterium GrIS 2.11]